uniref:RNase H type-1 domain-containing protein n=1 Tax=Cannabis sativa TaxID=3483 RepID=A0A803QLG2_CANSA
MVSPWAINYLWRYQDVNIGRSSSMGQSSCNVDKEESSIEVDLALGEVNLFMDVGIRYEDWKIGMGTLAYNPNGHVFFSSAASCVRSFEPHVAKAKALLQGLSRCLQLGYTSVTVFSDCSRLVLHVNSKDLRLNKFSIVLNYIDYVCKSCNSISLTHCKRSKNTIAHSLAKQTLDLDESRV